MGFSLNLSIRMSLDGSMDDLRDAGPEGLRDDKRRSEGRREVVIAECIMMEDWRAYELNEHDNDELDFVPSTTAVMVVRTQARKRVEGRRNECELGPSRPLRGFCDTSFMY